MKNNIALNMREIANQVNKEAEKANAARHEKLVEMMVLPRIQESAVKGKFYVNLSVPEGYDANFVCDILCEMGFSVDMLKAAHTCYLTISW